MLFTSLRNKKKKNISAAKNGRTTVMNGTDTLFNHLPIKGNSENKYINLVKLGKTAKNHGKA
jgi:hypothetical protein